MNNFSANNPQALLREGLAAAKSGDVALAKTHFLQAAEQDPDNDMIWTCLSAVETRPAMRMQYLRRALAINPASATALEMVAALRKQLSQTLVEQAIQDLESDGREDAEYLFLAATELDPDNTTASIRLRECAEWGNQQGALECVPPPLPAEVAQKTLLVDAAPEPDNPRDVLGEIAHVEMLSDAPQAAIVSPTDVGDAVPAVPIPQAADEPPMDHLEQQHSLPDTAPDRCNSPEAADTGVDSSNEEAERVKVILVVDSSATMRKLVAGALEKEGYSVIAATDGTEAIAKLGEVVVDLVLLDVSLSYMDGYQVCRIMRATDKDVPIVMLSAKDGIFDKVRGKVAGVTAHVTKPFLREDLVATVQQFCPLDNQQETFRL